MEWVDWRWPTRADGGRTVKKHSPLSRLGLPLSGKQIPQVVENLESGGKPKEALERVAVLRYQTCEFRERALTASPKPAFAGAGAGLRSLSIPHPYATIRQNEATVEIL